MTIAIEEKLIRSSFHLSECHPYFVAWLAR